MKINWNEAGYIIALGTFAGYMIYDSIVAYSISCKSLEMRKTSKYVGLFSFKEVNDANNNKLYFGDKPWKNLETLEKKVSKNA